MIRIWTTSNRLERSYVADSLYCIGASLFSMSHIRFSGRGYPALSCPFIAATRQELEFKFVLLIYMYEVIVKVDDNFTPSSDLLQLVTQDLTA